MCQTILKSFNRLKIKIKLSTMVNFLFSTATNVSSKNIDMILLKPFLFSLFVILIYTNDRYHFTYSLNGEETVRRFEREAKLKVENIKEKRFDRIYVYQNPDNIIQEATKLR